MMTGAPTVFVPETSPFGLDPVAKAAHLVPRLAALTELHRRRCPPYDRLLLSDPRAASPATIEDLPFLPVTVFKEFDLRSTDHDVMRISSSATTSGEASRIFVDKETRKRQNLSAMKLLADFIGTAKRP